MSAQIKKKILIVGGGSAGWMTAALMAKTLGDRFAIELVESSAIGTIGVGEGSTPKIAALFAALGVDEAEWMPACNATYKNGIRFKGWSSREGFESFFHGFYSHFDRDHMKALRFNSVLRRARIDVHAHPDLFLYNSYLADRHLAPTTPETFPFDVQYAFHFDAGLLGDFLKTWSMARGVTWRDCRIAGCEMDEAGEIAALLSDQGERLESDLFIDCSGFSALLIEKEMGAQHLSASEILFNDAAVAIRSPALENPPPMTTATTMPSGWAWHIPLQSRTGNGYVYSSRYGDSESAESELRAAMGDAWQEGDALHLKMRLGRVDRAWIGNCVAIGLSQGFLEPLEATGLALTQYNITRLMYYLTEHGSSQEARDGFNREVGDAFDGTRDFIAMHYLTATRNDTPYWRDVRANQAAISGDLAAVFKAWRTGGDFDTILRERRMTDYFSLHSWYYVMCGKGMYPDGPTKPPTPDMLRKVPTDTIADFLQRCALNHHSHAEQLAQLARGSSSPKSELDGAAALAILKAAVPSRDHTHHGVDF